MSKFKPIEWEDNETGIIDYAVGYTDDGKLKCRFNDKGQLLTFKTEKEAVKFIEENE